MQKKSWGVEPWNQATCRCTCTCTYMFNLYHGRPFSPHILYSDVRVSYRVCVWGGGGGWGEGRLRYPPSPPPKVDIFSDTHVQCSLQLLLARPHAEATRSSLKAYSVPGEHIPMPPYEGVASCASFSCMKLCSDIQEATIGKELGYLIGAG